MLWLSGGQSVGPVQWFGAQFRLAAGMYCKLGKCIDISDLSQVPALRSVDDTVGWLVSETDVGVCVSRNFVSTIYDPTLHFASMLPRRRQPHIWHRADVTDAYERLLSLH